jgi:hypothetical protein
MFEKVMRFLLSTTKMRLKKSSSSVACSFNLSFLVRVLASENDGFAHLRWI